MSLSQFAIFGASGFIGRHLTAYLRGRGHDVQAIGRDDFPAPGKALGHGVYCIGLTADFRNKLTDTARAHVGVLADVLDSCGFESFLLLSSTRVYSGASHGREDAQLIVPANPVDQVYNLSKLTAESLCLSRPEPELRVARLSNVVGPGDAPLNFLPSIVQEARCKRPIVLRTAPESARDYVDVDDVCGVVESIALRGSERLYNIGSGRDTSNAEIAALLTRHLGVSTSYEANAPTVTFPSIDISRVREEFGFSPMPFETSFLKIMCAPPGQGTP